MQNNISMLSKIKDVIQNENKDKFAEVFSSSNLPNINDVVIGDTISFIIQTESSWALNILVKNEVSLEITNSDNETLLDYAAMNENIKMILIQLRLN